jgi:hypothetical protein
MFPVRIAPWLLIQPLAPQFYRNDDALLSIAQEVNPLSVKKITEWFVDRHGEDYERKITAKWIGNIIRKKLSLKTQKSRGVFVIPHSEEPKLARLYEKYGIKSKEEEAESEDGA